MRFIAITLALFLISFLCKAQDTVTVKYKDSALKKRTITTYYPSKQKKSVESTMWSYHKDGCATIELIKTEYDKQGGLISVKKQEKNIGPDFSLIKYCKETLYRNGKVYETDDCLHGIKTASH